MPRSAVHLASPPALGTLVAVPGKNGPLRSVPHASPLSPVPHARSNWPATASCPISPARPAEAASACWARPRRFPTRRARRPSATSSWSSRSASARSGSCGKRGTRNWTARWRSKIPRKGQLDPDETEQFLREARAAAQLRHPEHRQRPRGGPRPGHGVHRQRLRRGRDAGRPADGPAVLRAGGGGAVCQDRRRPAPRPRGRA